MLFEEIIYRIVDAYQGIAKCDRIDYRAYYDRGELRGQDPDLLSTPLVLVDEFAHVAFIDVGGGAQGGDEPGAVPNSVPLPA